MQTVSRRSSRRGISLLEVMFSLGVVAVGLLGAIALLPVASHHVTAGDVADRADAIGQNAFNEFDLRGMNNPDNWVVYWPAAPGPATPPFKPLKTLLSDGSATPAVSVMDGFCIDPRFVAAHGNSEQYFPHTGVPDVFREDRRVMRRISLRAFPGTTPIPPTPVTDPPTPPFHRNTPMGSSFANALCIGGDDILLTQPDSRTDPATQTFFNDAAGNALSRASAGRFSWFATIVPKFTTTTATTPTDTYTLSTVVQLGRDPSMTIDEENERIFNLSSLGTGINGGDVTIDGSYSLEKYNFGTGNWVMLAQCIVGSGRRDDLATYTAPIRMRWYRIIGFDEETRSVSLYGPDWNVGYGSTVMIYAKDVVAVHEKIIRLDVSNLWTQS